jgi:hypothetical protein
LHEENEAEHNQAAIDQEWTSASNAEVYQTDEEQEKLQQSDQASQDTAGFPRYNQGIKALAGIVAFRLGKKHPELVSEESSEEQINLPAWLQSHSRSDSSPPSLDLIRQSMEMDVIFTTQHGLQLVDKKPEVMKRYLAAVASNHPDMKR